MRDVDTVVVVVVVWRDEELAKGLWRQYVSYILRLACALTWKAPLRA